MKTQCCTRRHFGVMPGLALFVTLLSAMTWRSKYDRVERKPPVAALRVRGVMRCTKVRQDDSLVVWHWAAQSIRFAVVWNARFQSHDLLWRNAGRDSALVRFEVVADGTAPIGGRRRLAAGERERLPGQSVTPRADGRVCVRVDTTR